LLIDLVHERGPLTVAAFMEQALYDPQVGYYARAARRSGRAGDFFTSVDVGPLFGELLEVQIAEMAALLGNAEAARPAEPAERASAESAAGSRWSPPTELDLVEAGAGDGRLAADVLRAARQRDPSFYESIRLHLVERSEAARTAQRDTLGDTADRLVSSRAALPESFEGVLIANELLDALPTHQVVMRHDGLKEVFVHRGPQPQAGDMTLTTTEGAPSSPAIQAYLDRLDVSLEPGWRAEVNLRAVEWIRDAARRLARGFIVLIDYGHDARELYSASHSAGTLTSFAAHRSAGPESDPAAAPWLQHPGERDITAHVDFTSVRVAAEAEGLTTIAFLDQTYFLMGLLDRVRDPQSVIRTPQFKTLIVPGGLGSTMKVLILGKDVGTPALAGCSFKVRVT
jgi:SAM-dependent MidA family methyltransferase